MDTFVPTMSDTKSSTISHSADIHLTGSSSSFTNIAVTTSTTLSDKIIDSQHMLQNIHLIWLASNIDFEAEAFCGSIIILRSIFSHISTFSDETKCVTFLGQLNDAKAILILSGEFVRQIGSDLGRMNQIETIYLLCNSTTHSEQLMKDCSKVKGIFTDINSLCNILRPATDQHDHESMSVTIVSLDVASKQDIDQLDPSFMYTQLLKEILFEINYDAQSVEDFITHCRTLYSDNPKELEIITMFEREYCTENAVWWYTYECFLYRLLNKALRNQEIDNLIKLGFFIRDLHRQLELVHAQQYGDQKSKSFTVYRGQSLPKADFEKLLKTPGGLISFNNFLSTSEDPKVSLTFGKGAQAKPGFVSILFEMKIETSVSSSPFALLDELSYFKDSEKEILFSTHTVFRIGDVKPTDETKQRWRVALTLTHDNDPNLNAVTQCMRKETEGSSGWHRLGVLLMKIGEYDKAEDIYRILLKVTTLTEVEQAYINQQVGWAKRKQGDYQAALCYYDKSREIRENHLSKDHPDFIFLYNNIGDAYKGMSDYVKALSYYEKALEIAMIIVPTNLSQLAASNNNIGDLYNDMAEYTKALSYYEKALDIRKKTLPPNHPDLAISNNNIGNAYSNIGDYSNALSCYEKVLRISQKTLPPNHPDFAIFHNNIGSMYDNMGEYTKALSYYEKALENSKNSLAENHPNMVNFYNNIGLVYFNLGELSKALTYYENALNVCQKSLSDDHPNLATCYNNIGLVCLKRGEYSEALSYYKKDLEISNKTLPPNHLDLGPSYNSIGLAYFNMGQYQDALTHYERALEICHIALPSTHPSLASCYNNIGNVYKSMGDYSKALLNYEKALDIREKCLPSNHPQLATSYNNIGMVHNCTGAFSKAILFYERAVECAQSSQSENHADLEMYKKNIDAVKHF
jgi:tetratricopeptide (TPR) repeat protein